MEDSIENKEEIYGRYEDQRKAISRIVSTLDELRRAHNKMNGKAGGLSCEEVVDYTIMALKITRSVTASGESEVDSYLDLANYARLICRARTGEDIIEALRRL